MLDDNTVDWAKRDELKIHISMFNGSETKQYHYVLQTRFGACPTEL